MYHFESSPSWWEDTPVGEHGLQVGVRDRRLSTWSGGMHRIRKRLIVGDYHPGTGREPYRVRTHVDKDKVVQSVIQLLGEGLSDGDTGAATAEDHDVLDGRWGGHGGRRGRRGGANIEGCSLYILGTVDSALSKSRDPPVIGRELAGKRRCACSKSAGESLPLPLRSQHTTVTSATVPTREPWPAPPRRR